MPFYEYKCSNCGHLLEELQSMKDAPLKKCPVCGKDTLQKLIGTGAGLIFKGSGFYLTDYKSKSTSGTETGKTEKTEPKTDSKSEQKKAGKTDVKESSKSKESAGESKASQHKKENKKS